MFVCCFYSMKTKKVSHWPDYTPLLEDLMNNGVAGFDSFCSGQTINLLTFMMTFIKAYPVAPVTNMH